MADRNHAEKGEKSEKEDEKTEEKDEKSRGEKWRRDPLGAIIWALILIWAGLVFLAGNMGWLRGLDPWGVIFLGAGVILFFEALARTLIPEYRRPVVGTLILGLVFVGIGLSITFGTAMSWGVIWAVILIIIGVSILLRGLRGRQ